MGAALRGVACLDQARKLKNTNKRQRSPANPGPQLRPTGRPAGINEVCQADSCADPAGRQPGMQKTAAGRGMIQREQNSDQKEAKDYRASCPQSSPVKASNPEQGDGHKQHQGSLMVVLP